jgi:hypothetical protein
MTTSTIKNVMMVQPASAGGNFEYIAIPRQGMLFLSGALGQWEGSHRYEREIWFEDRCGLLDPAKDLENVDILMITALITRLPEPIKSPAWPNFTIPTLSPLAAGPR